MKKILSLILTAILLTTASAALAGGEPDALDAFAALTGTVIDPTAAVTSEQYLDKVMNDAYMPAPADMTAAQKMAPELPGLSAVTTKDIAVYSVDKNLPAAQVRNKYFRSLANVLRAEIMVNPASEESYKNIQTILSLFLDESDDNLSKTTREAIRAAITPAQAKQIAKDYKLPDTFVEFIVMDDKWDDDDWTNDNRWKGDSVDDANWNTDDVFDSLEDYVDTDGINDNSVDAASQDADSVDVNSVDVNSTDSVKTTTTTTKKSSPDTPEYNSPDTPEQKPASSSSNKKPSNTSGTKKPSSSKSSADSGNSADSRDS